jgi:hypothetical protein
MNRIEIVIEVTTKASQDRIATYIQHRIHNTTTIKEHLKEIKVSKPHSFVHANEEISKSDRKNHHQKYHFKS